MLSKKIAYVDYNGNSREEVFYFNLSRAEIMEMELGVVGGMTQMLNSLVESEDGPGLSEMYKKIILKAYGEKSPDGKRFVKSKELRDAFEQTEAYSELYMELLSNPDEATNFFRGIMPAQVQQNMTEDHNKPALEMTGTVE